MFGSGKTKIGREFPYFLIFPSLLVLDSVFLFREVRHALADLGRSCTLFVIFSLQPTQRPSPFPPPSHRPLMVPSNIQGLNIIHPPSVSNNNEPLDLLSPAHIRDIAAQLDLWTRFSFQSDEPIIQSWPDDPSSDAQKGSDDLNDELNPTESAPRTDAPASPISDTAFPTSSPNFDISNVIPGFNPANASPSSLLLGSSLAQLLALQNAAFAPFPNAAESAIKQNDSSSYNANKRPRTRKTSASTVDESEPPHNSTPLTAAEDKRRRNTAASARFRQKKKEREAALESKAKELELKVTELERECEALRRENGWLKGLVVGVTGAAQQPTVPKTTTTTKGESRRDL